MKTWGSSCVFPSFSTQLNGIHTHGSSPRRLCQLAGFVHEGRRTGNAGGWATGHQWWYRHLQLPGRCYSALWPSPSCWVIQEKGCLQGQDKQNTFQAEKPNSDIKRKDGKQSLQMSVWVKPLKIFWCRSRSSIIEKSNPLFTTADCRDGQSDYIWSQVCCDHSPLVIHNVPINQVTWPVQVENLCSRLPHLR